MIRKNTILLGVAMLAAHLFAASEAEAGPLLDWLRGRRSCNQCQPQGYNYYGTQAPVAQNAYSLKPGQCMRTCQKTCTRTVVNYVPYTAYRTCWKRVPVTTYRPVTNRDPCTGCTVTCMRPCTTYTYQMQRIPYTTQRPVYRTETYKVPVTTITNDCATGACNTGCETGCNVGCDTCGTGTPAAGFAPTPAAPSNGSTYETPSFPSEPADTSPSISSTRSGSYVPNGTLSTGATYSTVGSQTVRQRPAVSIPADLKREYNSASASPVQRNWNYSPVRLASYHKPLKSERVTVRSLRTKRPVKQQEVNSFWKDVK